MRKWRTKRYFSLRIEMVDVDRESDSNVWVNGVRRAKCSEHERYFDSFDEAKNFLVQECEKGVATARRMLQGAQDQLGNAKGIKKPEGA